MLTLPLGSGWPIALFHGYDVGDSAVGRVILVPLLDSDAGTWTGWF